MNKHTPSDTPSPGLAVTGPAVPGHDEILTSQALSFVADLVRAHGARIPELLEARRRKQKELDAGEKLRFLEETRSVRESEWTVAPLPPDLRDRRVEITGPVDRKMIINALNSGANVFMADFEDSNSPTWANVVEGQLHLRDAVRGTIRFQDPSSGKEYALGSETAVLMVRPRGLHLPERHVELDGVPVPGSLFDFGLYFFHNAAALLAKGAGPYFYIPKLQSHLEARFWNDVFVRAQKVLGIPVGSIKATVLIETLPAAFEMDEILWELRDHMAGLNCGRWDYIFSFIKTHRNDPAAVLPDRGDVTMEQPFLRAYSQLLIRTCHRRGAFAMGGMAAQIPIKGDDDANRSALEKVRADKRREVGDGHDGTWVAHPGLVPIAKEIFDAGMEGANQLARMRDDVVVRAEDLLRVPEGRRTEEGLRHSIRVGVQYLEAWLGGTGCVPIYNLMEDAATAEICRTQIWQWVRHGARLDDGRLIDAGLIATLLDGEMERVRGEVGDSRFRHGRFRDAREIFENLSTSAELVEFLTLPAYERLP